MTDLHWFVVHCRAAQEGTAQRNLQQQGFEVYLPLLKQDEDAKPRPLFPCYLFIRFNPFVKSVSSVRNTRGVIDMIRFGGCYAVMSPRSIQDLQAQEDEGGIRHAVFQSLLRGEQVQMLEGPFAGAIATVAEDCRSRTVIVSLGAVARLSVARTSVERIC